MRIGILTFHRSINYGAFVQADALQKIIARITGEDVEIIDYDTPVSNRYYLQYLDERYKKRIVKILYINKKRSTEELNFMKAQRAAFLSASANQVKLSQKKLISDDVDEFVQYVNQQYDLIIVGSDEIWRVNGMRGFPNAYWLPEVQGCMKMSFAASSRENVGSLSEKQIELIKHYLDTFDYISLRDSYSKKMIDTVVAGKETHLMCDPTMAYDFIFDQAYGKKLLASKFNVDVNKPVIGVMDEFGKISDYLTKKYRNQVQIVPMYKYVRNVVNCGDINPYEWIQIIGTLDGLLTSFFHGMCISINANTPFRLFEYRKVNDRMASKSYDLLAPYHFENNYCQMSEGKQYKKVIDDFVLRVISGSIQEDYHAIKIGEQEKFTGFISALTSVMAKVEKKKDE